MPRTNLLTYYNAAPGFVYTEESPPAPPPHRDDPPPRRRLPTDDTLIGFTTAERAPVMLSAGERTQHLFVTGLTGQGKSAFFRWLIRQDVACGRGLVLLDPHYDPVAGMGPLVRDVLADMPWGREDDVIVLNLADDAWPFSLNLFSGEGIAGVNGRTVAIDQIEQAFKKACGASWGVQIEEWLMIIAHTFLENRRGTMADIPELLTNSAFRAPFLAQVTNPVVRTAWREAVHKKTGEIARERVESTLRRMNKFLMNPTLANIVNQERTSLDFARWMREGKIVLVTIPPQKIGKETTLLLGTMLLQLILRAAFTRPIDAPPFFVYADEAHHFVTPDIPEIIMGVRKHGVGLNLATQTLDNLRDEEIRKAVLAMGSQIIYQPTDSDAAILARGLATGPYVEGDEWRERGVTKQEIVTRLANLRSLIGVGRAHCKLPTGEYTVRVPFPRDGDSNETRASVTRIIERSRREYCRRVAMEPDTSVHVRTADARTAPQASAAPPPSVAPKPARTTRRRERLPLD